MFQQKEEVVDTRLIEGPHDHLGAPLPVIFLASSIANGIPIDAEIVPKPLPSCVLVGFIRTPQPV